MGKAVVVLSLRSVETSSMQPVKLKNPDHGSAVERFLLGFLAGAGLSWQIWLLMQHNHLVSQGPATGETNSSDDTN